MASDDAGVTRAAQYMRMSTDMQRYSVDNQAQVISEYAAARGVQIVRTYVDAGLSGLTLEKRPGLQRLLADIKSRDVDYELILVYDVSRWGRFQNADESGFYEFQCHLAGVRVEYCAEAFENDGTSLTTLLKTMKRVMAAEYSRDISKRVYYGQCRAAERGFWPCSRPPYGLRRRIVASDGTLKDILQVHERKAQMQDRVILVHGPPEEVEVVKRIFWMYADKVNPRYIAKDLNAGGIPAPGGDEWDRSRVARILENEVYVGTLIFNKSNRKMNSPRVRNPREKWIRAENAIEPIIERALFDRVQALRHRRRNGWPEEDIIAGIQKLKEEHGTVSEVLIQSSPDLPSAMCVYNRVGGVIAACKKSGFFYPRDCSYVEINQRLRKVRLNVARRIAGRLEELRGNAAILRKGQAVTAANGWTVYLSIGRYINHTQRKYSRWNFSLAQQPTHHYLALKMDRENNNVEDVYLFPAEFGLRKVAHIADGHPDRYADRKLPSLESWLDGLKSFELPSL